MSTEPTLQSDQVRRFLFEERPVRGHWVRLERAWRELRAHSAYPPPVGELLGQAVAAAVLLAATLKFRGTLTLQLQGSGAVNLLVAQCTHDFRLRAVARFEEALVAQLHAAAATAGAFRALVGDDGRFTVTIEADEMSRRYQGIVPLSGDSMARSLEAYFASSEQLPTRVLLAADDTRIAGLLLQKLPAAGEDPWSDPAAAWREAERGMERVAPAELLGAPVEPLLLRSFPGQDLRLFRGAAVRFECRCSTGRVAGVLRALGEGEMRDILREQGAVTVTCEFCHRPFHFDSIAIEALFAEGPAADEAPVLH
ncbi:MAG TPA: Hsp33 family molecular chaperone HslO [Steroidobacteraceae bacterium]|nr:Hsp33 family molecular chaperone HslO [Steroidobacteraceae bacterium]